MCLYLNGAVDLPREPQARVEADAPRQQAQGHRKEGHVAEVENIGGEHGGIEVAEINGRVSEDPCTRRSGREERTPPPATGGTGVKRGGMATFGHIDGRDSK